MINKIGYTNNIQPTSKTKKTEKTESVQKSDVVELSPEAKAKLEKSQLLNVIKEAPDVRMDKVEQAKANLEKYMSADSMDDTVANDIYDKIIDTLLG